MDVKRSLKRAVFRSLRWALRRYARSRPRPAADSRERVIILLWSAWGMGGTIRATLNFAGHLAKRHDVHVISVKRTREEPFFPFPEGITVSALDDRRPGATPPLLRPIRAALTARSSVLASNLDRMYRDTSLWTDLVLVHRLRRQTGFLITTRPGLNLLAADLAVPGLITIGQEQMHLRSYDRALRRAFKRSYPKLDALVVLTDGDLQRYDELLSGAVRLVRIPNTVRPNIGALAPLQGTTVLAAGRLSRQKGFDMLIEAFAKVAPSHPGWQLVVRGGGPWQRRLERLVAKHGLDGRVTLPGPAEPLADEMHKAAVFVLSSRFEGFPLVLLEAMAKGLAVVAFDCPTGPGEIIEDHRNGLLVPARDVDGLARGIGELIDDPDLRRRLGAAAAETAKRYTMDAIGPCWDALLDDLRTTVRAA